jgi:hypothetical protein
MAGSEGVGAVFQFACKVLGTVRFGEIEDCAVTDCMVGMQPVSFVDCEGKV